MALERFAAAWREAYVTEASSAETVDETGCVFCVLAEAEVNADTGVLWRGRSTFVTLNAFPYGSGHLLILPRRHIGDVSAMDEAEFRELYEAIRMTLDALEKTYQPDGMNVGMNLGRAAGAGIPSHLHAHVLPRWTGDTNFMTSIGETRVLPESLASTWRKVRENFIIHDLPEGTGRIRT